MKMDKLEEEKQQKVRKKKEKKRGKNSRHANEAETRKDELLYKSAFWRERMRMRFFLLFSLPLSMARLLFRAPTAPTPTHLRLLDNES